MKSKIYTQMTKGFVLTFLFVFALLQNFTTVAQTDGLSATGLIGVYKDAPPAANLDQARNGPFDGPWNPIQWVNGNVNQSQAHMVEDYSIPYRVVMTNMEDWIGQTVELILEYDTRHSGANALDFMTGYDNLEPHDIWGHPAEDIFPTEGYTGMGSPQLIPIGQPGNLLPVGPGKTTLQAAWASYKARKEAIPSMSIWNANPTLNSFDYVFEQDLIGNVTSTRVVVRFQPTAGTVILSWGGHIASAEDWGYGQSAGGISGSPYHTRLINWNINNLGNQDRSMQAAVVLLNFNCDLTVDPAVCQNELVTAQKTLPLSPMATYTWNITNGTTNATPTTGTGPTFTFNSGTQAGTLELKLTATVPYGNTTLSRACSTLVEVSPGPPCDITPAITTACPNTNIVFTGPPGLASYYWVLIDGGTTITTDPTLPSVTVHTSTACGSEFTIRLTVTDAVGCTNACSQTITIFDDTPPVLSNLPAGGYLGCNPSPPVCSTAVTATDNCDGTLPVTCLPGTISGTDCNKTQIFTYSAVDLCGNTATATVTYTWKSIHRLRYCPRCLQEVTSGATRLPDL